MSQHTPGPWRAIACVQNNGPNYWIVSDRAFGGTVRGKFASQFAAEDWADKLNRAAIAKAAP